MEKKKVNFFSLPKSKWIKIIGGILIIIWQIKDGIFYLPISGETIGSNIFTVSIIILGGWLIFTGIKQKNN